MKMASSNHTWKDSILLVIKQTKALIVKNLRLQYRSFGSLVAQLVIGVIFMILLLIVGVVISASYASDTTYIDTKVRQELKTKQEFYRQPICLELPCYSFAYGSTNGVVGRNTTAIELIINETIKQLNINSSIVYAFPENYTTTEVDDWLLLNQNRTKTIFLFENSNQWQIDSNSTFRYLVITNSSQDCLALGALKCNNPFLDQHIPLVTSVDAAFATIYGTNSSPYV